MRKRVLSRMHGKSRCRCGRKMASGSRSCRKCFEEGRGVYHGGRGRSWTLVLAEVAERLKGKPVGSEVTVDGLTFTKKAP